MNEIELRRATNLMLKLASQKELLTKLRGCTAINGIGAATLTMAHVPNAESKFPHLLSVRAVSEALGVTERRVGEAFMRALISLAAENVGRSQSKLNALGIIQKNVEEAA